MLIHRGLAKAFYFAPSDKDFVGKVETPSKKLFGDINSNMLEQAGLDKIAIGAIYDLGFHSESSLSQFHSTLDKVDMVQLPEVCDIPNEQLLPLIARLPLASPHKESSFNRIEEKLERALKQKIDQLSQIPKVLEFVYYALSQADLDYPHHSHKLLLKIKALVANYLGSDKEKSWFNLQKLFNALSKVADLGTKTEFHDLITIGEKILKADSSLESQEYSPERNLDNENYSNRNNHHTLDQLREAFDSVLSQSRQPASLISIIENFRKSNKQNFVLEIPVVAHGFFKEGYAETHFDQIEEILLKSGVENLVVRGLNKKGFINESRQLGKFAKSMDINFYSETMPTDQLKGKTLYLNYAYESAPQENSFTVLYGIHNITEGQSLYDGLENSYDNVKLSRALLLYYEKGREDFRKSFFVQDDSDSFSLAIPSTIPEDAYSQIHGDFKGLLKYDANLITYFVDKDDSGSSPIQYFDPLPRIKPSGPKPNSPREMRGRAAVSRAQRAGFPVAV